MNAPRTIELDATRTPLGRLATQAAHYLIGKDQPTYTPNQVVDVRVVIWNARQVGLTGRKATQRLRYRHSGYPGGLRAVRLGDERALRPDRLVRDAIARMLPKNKLQTPRLRHLTIHADGKPTA